MMETGGGASPLLEAGHRFRAERERRGWTLQQVADRTRITVNHLEGLEAGDYASMPAPVYIRGFVRTYAKLMDMDEEAQLSWLDRAGVFGSNVGLMAEKAPGPAGPLMDLSRVAGWVRLAPREWVTIGAVVLVGIVVGLGVKGITSFLGAGDEEVVPSSPFENMAEETKGEKPKRKSGRERAREMAAASPFADRSGSVRGPARSPAAESATATKPRAKAAEASAAATVTASATGGAAGGTTAAVDSSAPEAKDALAEGRRAYEAGKYREAVELLKRAVAEEPGNTRALEFLGPSQHVRNRDKHRSPSQNLS